MARNRDNSRDDAFDALDAFSSGKQPSEPAAPAPKPKPKPKPAPQPPAEAPQQAAKPRPKRPVAPPTPKAAPPAPQAPQPAAPAESSGRPATPPPVQPKARPVAARPAGQPASRPAAQPARAVAAAPARRQAAAQPVKKRSNAANAALRRKLAAAEKSETFRQTLIPVLITVAVMLLVLCTIGLMAIPDKAVVTEGEDHDGWDFSSLSMLSKPWAKYVILAGYPVAVVLAFGAWMFVMQSGRYKSLLASVTKAKQEESDSA